MNEMKCQGNCKKHTGEVKKVHVKGETKDWGFFYYCDVAIAEDIRNGLIVEQKTVTIEYHTGNNGQEVEHTIEAQVCPNCGSDNIELFYEMYWGGGEKSPYQIKCVDCRICGPEADTIPAAVELWNRITMS